MLFEKGFKREFNQNQESHKCNFKIQKQRPVFKIKKIKLNSTFHVMYIRNKPIIAHTLSKASNSRFKFVTFVKI